eukprot:IDg14810t1
MKFLRSLGYLGTPDEGSQTAEFKSVFHERIGSLPFKVSALNASVVNGAGAPARQFPRNLRDRNTLDSSHVCFGLGLTIFGVIARIVRSHADIAAIGANFRLYATGMYVQKMLSHGNSSFGSSSAELARLRRLIGIAERPYTFVKLAR